MEDHEIPKRYTRHIEPNKEGRKGLATEAFDKYERILGKKQISIEIKFKIPKAFLNPMLLYKCKICTFTKKLQDTRNAFQRQLLRKRGHSISTYALNWLKFDPPPPPRTHTYAFYSPPLLCTYSWLFDPPYL